jgi:cysteinyl-tRNA synthetase
VHGGLLLFDNKKMSKSLGNFEPLSGLLERYDPQAIRLLFLQTGYRKVMNFTQESIAAAGVVLERLKKSYRALKASPQGTAGLLARVETALDDDMNTSVALAEVLQYESPPLDEFERALELLGVAPHASWLEEEAKFAAVSPSSGDEIDLMVLERERARSAKDWASADRLRKALTERGVELIDTPEGPKWRRIGAR